jgi:hypothetical protein
MPGPTRQNFNKKIEKNQKKSKKIEKKVKNSTPSSRHLAGLFFTYYKYFYLNKFTSGFDYGLPKPFYN